MSLSPHRFGPYVIVRHIGSGSMGNVYAALMGTKGREKLCVIKRMNRETLAEQPNALERVQRESEIARRLSHGAIAQTFAVGDEDGVPYLVQEFVHGWSLNRLLEDCVEYNLWPSIPLACHIVREVARGLAYVHGAGVVHRDIAPENIMIAYTGEVKVIDFGIAKEAGEGQANSALVGRYTYGAPELRVRTVAVDTRSDLYGLGVVLWSLIAHRRDPHPFLRERRPTALTEDATIEAPPSPSMFNPEVPRELDAVVMRALAYLPEDRYQTANELQDVLARYIPTTGFVGEEEMKKFVRLHTDPTFALASLQEAIERARTLLDDEPPRASVSPLQARTELASPAKFSHDWTSPRPRNHGAVPAPLVFAGVIDNEPRPILPGASVVPEAEPLPKRPTMAITGPTPRLSIWRSQQAIYAAAAVGALVIGAAAMLVIRTPKGHQQRSRDISNISAPTASASPLTIGGPPGPLTNEVSATPDVAVKLLPTARVGEAEETLRRRARTTERKRTPVTPAEAAAAARAHDATTAVGARAATAYELLAVAQSALAQNYNDQAVEVGRRAVAAGAGAAAHLIIGNALMKQRRFTEAERAFADAARLEPGNHLARLRLTQAQEQLAASRATTSREPSD